LTTKRGETVLKGIGMTMHRPEYEEMKTIIQSPEGQKAAMDATNDGRPALNGVDPLLQAALGRNYSQENFGPLNAGYEVAAVMRELGYTDAGRGACDKGRVARSGQKWKPKG
jgi:hypothetical protein